jgi:hypothetical protein
MPGKKDDRGKTVDAQEKGEISTRAESIAKVFHVGTPHSVGHTARSITSPQLAQNAQEIALRWASFNAQITSKPGNFQRMLARSLRFWRYSSHLTAQ